MGLVELLRKELCMLVIRDKPYSSNMIRQALKPHLNKLIKIKYNLGRNKYETFNARVIGLYNYVFLVELENKIIKSFSYADIITKVIKIYE